MYSPYDAVYGHDTTYIQRMTVEEYVKELQDEEADVRGQSPSQQTNTKSSGANTPSPASATPLQCKQGTRSYEQRRAALSSRNPNVVFSSKYPMYDRLGRELCVAFQIQDMAVQQELRRLECEAGLGERDSRRSGVRLSTELPMGSDGTATFTRPASLAETQPPSLAEDRESAFSEAASRLVPPSHVDNCDSLADLEVSATSHYPSVSASRTSSRPASARPSEFSIFRESGVVAVARGGISKARSSIPMRTIAEENRILVHREAVGNPLRATSVPAPSSASSAAGAAGVAVSGDAGEGRWSAWRRRSEKRHRSRSSGGRLSRVRFLNEERDAETHIGSEQQEQQQQQEPVRAPGAAAPLPRRLLTPPPVPLSDLDQTQTAGAATEEATRWTTLPRGSAAVRATKQLFRSTTHTANVSRITTTLTYAQPIPSAVYGLSAPAIAAGKVSAVVEKNVAACAAAMPQHYTDGFAMEDEIAESRRRTPELQCGSVVQLGKEWYRLVHFHVVAEVYEAVRIDAPASREKEGAVLERGNGEDSEQIKVGDGQAIGEKAEADAMEETAGSEARENVASPVRASPASCKKQAPTLFAADASPAAASLQQQQQQQQQYFVYRWRASSVARGIDEARRAALGLSLCAPHVHVTGFNYADGGGVTLVTLLAGYHAVPVSALPLSLRSYTTLLRTVLKALSAMVARRTIHGNVAALGDLFLVLPVDSLSHTPKSAESPRVDGPTDYRDHTEANACDPFVLLFHWERWVDFGMFVDRNAGRTLPFDFEDGSAQTLVHYSSDLLSGLQLFLEHALAAELSSEQYILLQKLILLAAEPTRVASHLIQLKNLMLTLPTDTIALQKSFEAAFVYYTSE